MGSVTNEGVGPAVFPEAAMNPYLAILWRPQQGHWGSGGYTVGRLEYLKWEVL